MPNKPWPPQKSSTGGHFTVPIKKITTLRQTHIFPRHSEAGNTQVTTTQTPTDGHLKYKRRYGK